MKKLLTILTGFTITLAPVSQIVSCKIAEDNTYSKSSDIEKFWLYKSQNTVVFGEDTEEKCINNEIKKLISFNFKNQDEVNYELGIKVTDEYVKDDLIKFKFYSAEYENTVIEESKLIDFLNKELAPIDSSQSETKMISSTKSIYFKYKLNEEEFNSKFLQINFTNIPIMQERIYFDKSNDTKQAEIKNYFFSNLKNLINKNDKIFDEKFIKDNKNEIIFFIKGILNSIRDKNDNEIKLSNSIEWVDVTNKHSSRKKEWRSLTPEETLYKLILEEGEKPDESFINFTKELIENGKIECSDFAKWLGLKGKTFIIK